MDPSKNPTCTKKASLSDVEEGTCLTFDPQFGARKFLIGLSSEDKVCMVKWESRHKDRAIVVDLFCIHLEEETTFYLTPINSDLPCFVNRNLTKEKVQLLKEARIQIGDKRLLFSDGTRRPRKLPPTPGVLILPSAPPKPKRLNGVEVSDEDIRKEDDDGSMSGPDSWQFVPSPGVEFEVIHGGLQHPDQIASVSASHVVRQMMLFTDLKMSVTMMDELYRAFRDVVETNREMLCEFLQDSKKEMELQRRARSSGHVTSQPLHGPVIELLVALLKHSLEPVSNVILWLLFLRTLGHFTQNLGRLIRSQAAAAIMGSMAVYPEVPEVQQYGLEILCKLATHNPNANEKAPVREAGVEMIVRAMRFHDKNLAVLRPACRALANLATTITELQQQHFQQSLSDDAVRDAFTKWQDLIGYITSHAVPVVEDVMAVFPRDLGVHAEARRLLSVLRSAGDGTVRRTSSVPDLNDPEATESDVDDIDDDSKPGILKNARSFENLRSPTRRVQFSSQTIGGAVSDESIFQSSVEASGRFDGSGRFTDSFGNQMDMPESASYIGEDVFFPHVNSSDTDSNSRKGFPQKIYCPPSHDSQSEIFSKDKTKSRSKSEDIATEVESNAEQSGSVLSDESAKNLEAECQFDSLAAEMDNAVNQKSESNQMDQSNPVVEASEEAPPIPAKRSNRNQDTINPPPPIPPREPIVKRLEEQPLPLAEIKPSCIGSVDVKFMTRLMRTLITRHICSLVLTGEDSQALQAIDQPIGALLASAHASDFLLTHLAKEYQPDKSLMDIDPSMVISIIDAVRYRSLTCDLLRSSLTELIGRIDDQLNLEVLACAFDCLHAIIGDVSLESLFSDKKFVRQLMKSLPQADNEYLQTKFEELQVVLADLL